MFRPLFFIPFPQYRWVVSSIKILDPVANSASLYSQLASSFALSIVSICLAFVTFQFFYVLIDCPNLMHSQLVLVNIFCAKGEWWILAFKY